MMTKPSKKKLWTYHINKIYPRLGFTPCLTGCHVLFGELHTSPRLRWSCKNDAWHLWDIRADSIKGLSGFFRSVGLLLRTRLVRVACGREGMTSRVSTDCIKRSHQKHWNAGSWEGDVKYVRILIRKHAREIWRTESKLIWRKLPNVAFAASSSGTEIGLAPLSSSRCSSPQNQL